MVKNNLTKNIQVLGNFFLPNSNKKIPGVFKYNNGQSQLELLHLFEINNNSELPVTFKTIHGETKMGKVTLTDVIFNHSITSQGSVYLAIFGSHLQDNHSMKNLGFNFDYLNEWAISKYPYTATSFEVESIKSMQNTYEQFSCTVNDIECTLHISLGVGSSHLKGIKNYHLSSFTLKSEKNKNIVDYINLVLGIQQFLMLIMGRKLNLNSMSTKIENYSHDVYMPVLKNNNKGSDLDHFFNISYMRINYTEILTNWFDFYLKNKYLLNLFFDTMEKQEIEDTDFYVYASMLEGYYKSKYDGEKDYEKRISVVLKPFKSQFSNIHEFVKEIILMRHDIFHFNKRKELDVDKLYRLTHDLFFIIRILLLNGTGLDVSMDTNVHIKKLVFLKKITNNEND